MVRRRPGKALQGVPCSIVAVRCAMGDAVGAPDLRDDGYATLDEANKYIRAKLKVKKRVYYRRLERPRLKDLHLDGRAIVCVLGHYLYLDHETYYSFFNNEDDQVVTVWVLEGAE